MRLTPTNPRTAVATAVRKTVVAIVATFAVFAVSASVAEADFGLVDPDVTFTDAGGAPSMQAGSHPFDWSTAFNLNRFINEHGSEVPDGDARDIRVEFPPGLVANLTALPRCKAVDFVGLGYPPGHPKASGCPDETVVGVHDIVFGFDAPADRREAVYNLEPPPGVAARLGFAPLATPVTVDAGINPFPPYNAFATSTEIPQAALFYASKAFTVWGNPSSSDHDSVRGECVNDSSGSQLCPVSTPEEAFTVLPRSCSGPLTTGFAARSWQDPGVWVEASAVTNDGGTPPQPLGVSGCASLVFDPQLDARPTSGVVDGASGFSFELDFDQQGLVDPDGRAQSDLKGAVVRLPEGVSVNPSSATGLEGCTDAQLGLHTGAEPACPDGSRIGTVEVTTPLLDEDLDGEMVLLEPKSTDPQSGDMFRGAIIVRNEARGILVKVPGQVVADPVTGRVTASFDDNPQLPFDHLKVNVKGGERGALALPQRCGEIVTSTTMTPWSATSPVDRETAFEVGGDCSNGFAPKLDAGMDTQTARAHGRFSFRFSRRDGEQWLRGLTAKLPKGLLASVKDLPLCTNAQADAGACPQGSKIGIVDAKAGSGDPFVLEEKGEVFLTEGYKGGPYGLAVKIRAVAGPFRGAMELSPIVVRQKIDVDRRTAQVTATSDPFPLVHHGVPLRVREVTVLVDRDEFMLNPSGCSEKRVSASILSAEGTNASLSNPFQAAGCANLPFKPKLGLRLTGRKQVTTGKHPGIRAQVDQQGIGEAGFAKATVRLPKSLALDPDNAQALCEYTDGTKPDIENHCPKGSIVGRARATSPLLNDPLAGNVYFVKNIRTDKNTGNQIRTLPMIIVALRGEIAVNLRGTSSTTTAGKLVNTFATVPDAPVDQFNLNINGGRNGILAVTRTRRALINLCAGRHTAEADTDAQNGRRHDFDIRMKTPCTKRQTKAARRAAKARKARS